MKANPRSARKTNVVLCSALLAGASLLPVIASANDGSINFRGTLYEAPCNMFDNSMICYSGSVKQTITLANLLQSNQTRTLSGTIRHKVMAGSNMTIVTISYL